MGKAEKSSSSSAENPSLLAGRNWLERLLVGFIAKRTPKCRQVVKLLSQSMEVKLPVATRIKIQFHYLICIFESEDDAPGDKQISHSKFRKI